MKFKLGKVSDIATSRQKWLDVDLDIKDLIQLMETTGHSLIIQKGVEDKTILELLIYDDYFE